MFPLSTHLKVIAKSKSYRINYKLQLIETKRPYAIPAEILEIGSAFSLQINTAKDSELKSDKDSNISKKDKSTSKQTRSEILNAKKQNKRKRSVLGNKMYAQSLSFSPKNSSVSKNEFTFQNLSNIDWRVFADKIRQYVTKLNILLNQKLNQTETTMSQDKNTNEFKQLTWSKVKFSKNLSQLVENKPIIE